MEFQTHDFCGTTIYECPHCPFDDERIAVVRQHVLERHPAPPPPPTTRPAEAKLYAPSGEVVTAIPIPAAPDAADVMSEDIDFQPEEH